MALIFKRQNTRQPQGVVQLDGQNPLTQRPAFVWVPNRNRELVQQSSWSLSGSTPPTIVGTPAGVATKHTSGVSTVSYVDLGTPTASVDLGTVPSTYVGVFYASAASGVAIAERNDANAVNIGWVLGYVSGNNAGTYGLGFVQEHSTTNSRKSISNAVVAGLNVLVVTYDGGLAAAGINVYLNGVLGTVNGSQDGVGTTGTDAARNLYVGRCSYDTSRSHNGSILLAGAFKRIWSAAEVLSFSRNPWQIFQSPPRELQLDVPATGTTVNPGVGSLAFTGFAPTIAQPQTASPAVGALTLTGFAPSVVQSTLVNPGVGSLTFTGFAPGVLQNTNVAPGAGSLTFTGYSPSIAQPQTAAPGVGSITFTGYVPTVSQSTGQAVTPNVGALTFTGYAPSIAQPQAVGPGVGAVVFTGYAPSIAQPIAVAPGAGSLALTGFAPTLAQTANQAVLPGVGVVTLTGFAPTVTIAAASQSLVPDSGVLTITGYAPTVQQSSAGGIDTWGSVYVREKKKKKREPATEPVAGPTVREFIESAMQAHGSKPASVEFNDEDEEEIWMLLS